MKHKDGYRKEFGYKAEKIALQYYIKAGFTPLAQNVTTRNSELDLVLHKKSREKDRKGIEQEVSEILFVEVKAVGVNNISEIKPEDNFTPAKQKHFKRGIELYLAKTKDRVDRIRIDLACVYYHREGDRWSIKVYDNIILD